MSVLDIILVEEVLDTPTTVNSDHTSKVVDLTWREGEFSVQVEYDGGVNVDMTLHLEFSSDGISFTPVTDKEQVVTDSTHTHIWDVAGTGTAYMRVFIEVRTGSINLQRILYKGKRRH
jgi:hypothetical protein